MDGLHLDHEKNTAEKSERKVFAKGVVFGILITICGILTAGNIGIAYRMIYKKEINYVKKAREVYSILKNNYVDDFTTEDLYDGVYYGMVANTTDKYSCYFNAENFEDFTVSTEGNYGGIGVNISLDENGRVIFVNVYEDSPAAKVGIEEGDKLLKVDDTEVGTENYSDIADMVRGEEGSKVVLTVLKNSDGSVVDLTLTREIVNVPTAASAMLTGSGDEKIGYIVLSGFEGVTAGQFEECYNNLLNQGAQGLIIDLRNNPGGLLTSVSEIADILLPKGVITYTEDKNGKKEYVYANEGEIEIPLVILVNGRSASASELLTAAVKDTQKGVVVGTNTYGKGVVQTTFPLTDGSAVKVTTAKYYTPNGICIDGVGVEPDVDVELNPDYVLPVVTRRTASYNTELDNQLAEGIKQIENKLK